MHRRQFSRECKLDVVKLVKERGVAAAQAGPELVGLHKTFAPNIVSAAFVARGKPAPDVFMYAAGSMGTVTTACVIRRRQSSRGAGGTSRCIRGLGFADGSHCPLGHEDALIGAGAQALSPNFRELKRLLPEAF